MQASLSSLSSIGVGFNTSYIRNVPNGRISDFPGKVSLSMKSDKTTPFELRSYLPQIDAFSVPGKTCEHNKLSSCFKIYLDIFILCSLPFQQCTSISRRKINVVCLLPEALCQYTRRRLEAIFVPCLEICNTNSSVSLALFCHF